MKRAFNIISKAVVIACFGIIFSLLASPITVKATIYEYSSDVSTSDLVSQGVGNSDTLKISESMTITIDQDLTIQNISIKQGKTLTIRNAQNNNNSLHVINYITNNDGNYNQAINIYGNVSAASIYDIQSLHVYSGNVSISGRFDIAGSVTVENGNINADM